MCKLPPLLHLRPFALTDADAVVALAGDREVSRWTTRIPHPYHRQHAIDWIGQPKQPDRRAYAVDVKGVVTGCVSYWPDEQGVEVGYWVGRPFWGNGLATRALQQMLALPTFPSHQLVTAQVMVANVGSQRVLEKCGFCRIGRDRVHRQAQSLDAFIYTRAPNTPPGV